MIGSLRGQVLDRTTGGDLLVEVGGVGYRVAVPPRTLVAAGESGEPIFLHVHTHVREDAIVLYGFATAEERVTFEALLVGAQGRARRSPRHHQPPHAHGAAPGRRVRRRRRPLRGAAESARPLRLDSCSISRTSSCGDLDAEATLAAVNGDDAVPLGARADVRAALANLGYGPDEITFAIRDLPDETDDASTLLRVALKTLAGAR